jgi:zinc protease
LRQPVFAEDQLEKLCAQLLTGLAIRSQRTEEMASLAFEQNLFKDHPYGNPVDGFSEMVQTISREDIVNFHEKYYGPEGVVVVVVGGISPQQVVEQVQAALGDWRNPRQTLPQDLPRPEDLRDSIRQHVELPEKSQTDLVMGTLGPARNSSDYLPASLGNSILGKFGMMGRIGDVVREQSGLAYYASANLNASLAGGSWEVSAGVNPANLQKAIELISKEIQRFVEEPVTAQELEDNKSYFIGRLPLLMESNSGVAGALMNIERFNLGLDYYRLYPGEVQKVTSDLVLEAARTYIDPHRLVICSAGTALENGK